MTATRDRSFDAFHLAIGAVALVFVCQLIIMAMHFFGWLPLAWHRSSVPYFVWGAVMVAAAVWSIIRLLSRKPPPLAAVLMIGFAMAGATIWGGYSHFVSFVEAV
ncbi:MAG: hypothetical protein NCW75_04665 [Phycisphaera sp.]|nr:MAG: hypothetical protein NCW75_04665 [Phycisphaera sp.]